MAQPLEVTMPSDREVRVTRNFDAPRALVFEAWTTPALVSRWLLGPPGWTMPVCEIDARVGGGYRYVWRSAEGSEMGLRGTYRAIDAPERMASVETFDEAPAGSAAEVTMVLTEDGGITTMTMTIRYGSRDVRDAMAATGMTDGMEMSFQHLDQMLAAG